MFVASTVAGAVNAVAGGGSLITFPVLVWLGRPAIIANATNTVSLSPGSIAALWGFRHELTGMRRWVIWLSVPSILGGLVGAWLLLRTPERVFDWLVPWLIAFATALFAFSGPVTSALRKRVAPSEDGLPVHPQWTSAIVYQFFVSVYGGYFGAGIGIMMLAGLAIMGFTGIHRMIALRNVYAIWINGIAALYFIAQGAVLPADAVVLTIGQILGSYGAARIARRLPASVVRGFVVSVGVAMALGLFLRSR
jgi:uncharacterized membrane protein YfcA